MPLLDVQRRGQQIGRIRVGQQVATGETYKDGRPKMRPVKLSTFRFTTASRTSADAIAALYGGEVREWEYQGERQWEVITRKSEIGVTVPPRDEVISQWYEMWTKGGCQRRCDSRHEQISNGPCLCPADPRERAELAKRNPPQACKGITRISVMIPDLPGLGVFRLDSGSYYAAVEIGDSAQIMQMARDKGIFLPAILRIEQRSRVANGQTKKFPVPVLEVLATFRDLATGAIEAGGLAAQLPPAPGEPLKAIASGPAAAPPASPAANEQPADDDDPLPADDEAEQLRRAQAIADQARTAGPRELRELKKQAEDDGLSDQWICTDRDRDDWSELLPYLEDLWHDGWKRARSAS